MTTLHFLQNSNRAAALFLVVFFSAVIWRQTIAQEQSFSRGAFANWRLATTSELENARGGFVLGNGVEIDIGIRTAGFVGDGEQFSGQFDLADELHSDALSGVHPSIRVGSEKFIRTVEVPANINLIQNTLDNQFVRNLTVIGIDIKNWDIVRGHGSLSFQSFYDSINPGLFD